MSNPWPETRPVSLVAAIVALNLLLSLPALLGDWVYDDFTMLDHPLMDGWDDLWDAFFRNSDDYLFVNKDRFMSIGSTYRPLSMGSLILVNALFGYNALAHHMLSFFLHILNVCVLCKLCWNQVRLDWGLVLMSAAVALHPSLCEAYGWINGRSDVLAGSWWVLWAWWLGRREGRAAQEVGWGQSAIGCGVGLVLVAGGLLSKSVFGVAAATILAVVCLPPAGVTWNSALVSGALRRCWGLRGEVVGLVAGVGLYVWMKANSGQVHATTQQSVLGLFDGDFFRKVPQMVGKGVGALVELTPKTMRLLAWDLYQPWSALEVIGFAGVCGGLAVLVWRRRHREIVCVLGALGVFLPVLLVSEHFWLGFDRYLYLPVLMLTLPGAQLWGAVLERWPEQRRLMAVLAGVIALLSGVSHVFTASHYANQETFVESLARYRPEDPTASMFHLRALSKMEDVQGIKVGEKVGEYLKITPFPDRAPALLVYMRASYEFQANQIPVGIARVNRSLEEDPENLYLRVLSLDILLRANRFEDALSLSADLLQNPTVCEHVTSSLLKLHETSNHLEEVWPVMELLMKGSVCALTLQEKARVYEKAR